MNIKIKFDAAMTLRALESSPQTTIDHMRMALLESCRKIRETARERHRFKAKTGALERAMSFRVDAAKRSGTKYLTNISRANSMFGEIFIDEKIAPYGKYVHEPTGIYGPKHRKYLIAPKNKKMLRWARFIDGAKPISVSQYKNMRKGKYRKGEHGFVLSKKVMHPGSAADQFIYIAAQRQREWINDIFARHTQSAIKEAGL